MITAFGDVNALSNDKRSGTVHVKYLVTIHARVLIDSVYTVSFFFRFSLFLRLHCE